MQSDIASLFPVIYRGFVETDELARAEDVQFNTFFGEMDDALHNQFAQTANATGIAACEKLYNIRSDPATEDLEFRRQRVLGRMRTAPPFTRRWLHNWLASVCGAQNYSLSITGYDVLVKVWLNGLRQALIYDIAAQMRKAIPANMSLTARSVQQTRAPLYLAVTPRLGQTIRILARQPAELRQTAPVTVAVTPRMGQHIRIHPKEGA